ncbi:MAG TPA: IPT/TIG domain-containing protein [Pyrinomonadaceae bacterium]|nr:IPT/TIG domain-containing protein [Pyrinomonadaceae bacterium]
MAHNSPSPSHSTTRLIVIVLSLCVAVWVGDRIRAQAASDITYVYDELGRLVAVIDSAGETAVYTYDAVGNLLSISRFNSSVVSIIHFSPNKGPVGTPVTIYGTSFSTTASQNTVTFNGVAATVTSASATQIVTSVPAGAATGPISVTSPTGSATSTNPFTISTSTAPTITNFTPTIGTQGTSLSITGTNFETTASNNWVTLNNRYSLVSAATSTTISTSVPSLSTSGRVSVGTPAGKAVSAADFFVPPAPFTAGEVEVTGRTAVGESKTVTITTGNKIGLIVFDGTALQRVSLVANSFSMTGSSVTIYNPDGTQLAGSYFYSSGSLLETPVLPATGTYTILIDPENTNTGSITFTLYNATDVTSTITPGGPAVTVTTTSPGQNAMLTFGGTAGQRVSLKLSNSTFTGCYAVNDVVKNPDGTTLTSGALCSAAGFVDAVALPVTGTYTVLIDPQGITTGSQTLLLIDVPADVTASITPGGASVTLTTTTPGQNARATFAGYCQSTRKPQGHRREHHRRLLQLGHYFYQEPRRDNVEFEPV